jgi:Putative metallopeptidase
MILSPLRLPEELTVKTMECSKVNAWYSRENSKPTVTVCYELLKHILESLPKEPTSAGFTPEDAAVGQFIWFSLHEVGHAVFDIFNVPIFGNEEDAADNFATYIMLQNQRAETFRLIGGAAWAWWAYMKDYRRNPVVQVRLEGFASDHGLPQERFYNLLCLAYGADPVLFDDLTQVGYLPPTRAPRCKREYAKLADAFHKESSPHIDQEMAKITDKLASRSGCVEARASEIAVAHGRTRSTQGNYELKRMVYNAQFR